MSRPFSTENAFRAIAHPARRRIIELLAKRELRPGEMAADLGRSRPGASQHLRVLRESGLIIARREGTSLVYRLNPHAVNAVAAWWNRIVNTPAKRN